MSLLSDASDQMQFVREQLARHRQAVIATSDDQSMPWAACVNMAYDNDLNIVWVSRNDTRHSQNIAVNPHVAICVYSESQEVGDFGFYADAAAHQVTEEAELASCLELLFKSKDKPAPSLDKLDGDAPLRMYKAIVSKVWINDSSRKKQLITLES